MKPYSIRGRRFSLIGALIIGLLLTVACRSDQQLTSRPASPSLLEPGLETPLVAGLNAPTATSPTTTPPAPSPSPTAIPASTPAPAATATPTPLHPLAVEVLRLGSYPGSEIRLDQTLDPGPNYNRYLASYRSDGLTIYSLLTVPTKPPPATGWPAIVFNHGYIPPAQYRTGERYVAYVDAFARNGYIVLMPDYRGHGDSEGEPSAGYGSTAYTIDVLNALQSLQRFPEADPARLGIWGHSLGGGLTLRTMVIVDKVKAGVIWAGVVGPYPDIINAWTPPTHPAAQAWHNGLINEFGRPALDLSFWDAISPNSYLAGIAPLQLHHGTADSSVPLAFSETLAGQLEAAGRTVEFYSYEGDDHNLSQNLSTALARSVEFFDRYVKNAP